MRKLAFIASSLFVAVAIFACRGSVDRAYFDDQQEITGAEAGHDADASQLADGGTGDGDTPNRDKDAETTETGQPPNTAPALINVTVSDGLAGSGLVLQDNGADDMAIPAPGTYTFNKAIPPGQTYDVKVANQPIGPTQTCTVLNGSGTAAGVDVDNIRVNCVVSTFAVGGSVVGLKAGQSVTLTNNGANDQVVSADGAFAFPALKSGGDFNVAIKSSTSGTTCTVSGGVGTIANAAVDSVVVNCGTNTYTVGGTVTHLTGTLVVTNNGGNDRTITANGGYAFSTPIASGSSYAVAVKSNPTYPPQAQTCTVSNASGAVGAGNVGNVNIDCVTNKYTVGGTVTGLTGNGLKLQNKGTDDKSIAAGGTGFTFATSVASGSTYGVTVVTQPEGQTCSVANGSGTIGKAAVANVAVNCSSVFALQQNFESADIGGLPSGWTSVALFNASDPHAPANTWTTEVDGTSSKFAFIPDSAYERDVALTSPSFLVSSAAARLSFSHEWDTEPDWDGGMLEINIAGAGWFDILDPVVGGSFAKGGYNTTLLDDKTSTVGGRRAWSGADTKATIVNLPASCAGKMVQLRWRFGSDQGTNGDGWTIDDIVVTN